MRTLDPVRHDEKRQEILGSAAKVIARDGFGGASTADICKEAGISPGHLYHYFEGKEEILAAITEKGMKAAAARFAEMASEADAVTALVAALDRHKGKRDATMRSFNLMLLDMMVEAGRNPAIAKIVRRNSATLRGLLAEFLRVGQARGQIDKSLDANIAGGFLLSLMDGDRKSVV